MNSKCKIIRESSNTKLTLVSMMNTHLVNETVEIRFFVCSFIRKAGISGGETLFRHREKCFSNLVFGLC